MDAPRVRRRAVMADEPLADSRGYDYADAFEASLPPGDSHPAEYFFRVGLQQAPRAVAWVVVAVHRYLLRFRLGPLAAPDRLLGWRIDKLEPDVVKLEASGPLMRATLIGRKVEPASVTLTTYVFYQRPIVARIIWTLVAPLHRRVARFLMQRAASAAAVHVCSDYAGCRRKDFGR
jgi:hypothetical protein